MGKPRCCVFAQKIFYVLSKTNESGNYTVVYRSELQVGESPIWNGATIPIRSLNNGDKDRCLQIECFQWGLNGYHSSLGLLYTTVNKMESLVDQEPVKLVGKNGLVSLFTLKTTVECVLKVMAVITYFC